MIEDDNEGDEAVSIDMGLFLNQEVVLYRYLDVLRTVMAKSQNLSRKYSFNVRLLLGNWLAYSAKKFVIFPLGFRGRPSWLPGCRVCRVESENCPTNSIVVFSFFNVYSRSTYLSFSPLSSPF